MARRRGGVEPGHERIGTGAGDRDTHALIRDQPRSSRASTSQGLQKNADGSVDVFFGPEQPLFDKTWQLPDIEEVK